MCSGIALLGVTAVMVVPTGLGAALGVGINLSDNEIQGIVYAALFIWYFLCTLVAVFCNAALISCALQSFSGRPPTIGSGFAAAAKRLPQILGGSLLAATVGVILQAVESLLTEKLGFFGDLLSGIFSALWGVATYFAIPVVVTEDVGPIRAIKRSSALLRRSWGESLAGSGGLGLISKSTAHQALTCINALIAEYRRQRPAGGSRMVGDLIEFREAISQSMQASRDRTTRLGTLTLARISDRLTPARRPRSARPNCRPRCGAPQDASIAGSSSHRPVAGYSLLVAGVRSSVTSSVP